LQFAATTTRAICRLFQLFALGRSFFGRTFNPEVAGSNPWRPDEWTTGAYCLDGMCNHGCWLLSLAMLGSDHRVVAALWVLAAYLLILYASFR
jgi:hypothetical protein